MPQGRRFATSLYIIMIEASDSCTEGATLTNLFTKREKRRQAQGVRRRLSQTHGKNICRHKYFFVNDLFPKIKGARKNDAFCNKPPICRDERPLAGKVNSAHLY